MAYIDKIKARGVNYDIEAQTLSGLTSSISELNQVSGVTSNIQTQLNNKEASGAAANVQTNLDAHEADSTIHVTSADKEEWSAKYDKPSSGIPSTDLATAVQDSLGLADTALQASSTLNAAKLSGEIPGAVTAITQDKTVKNTTIATTAYVGTAINDVLEASKAMTYEGTVDTTHPLPAVHTVGDTYVVAEAGRYAGEECKVGDMIICKASGTTDSNADWNVVHAAGGNMSGPASSTVDHVVTFANDTGNSIKDSGFTIGTSVPADAVFTDNNTTYTFEGGTNQFTVTPSGGSAQTVAVIPSVSDLDASVITDGVFDKARLASHSWGVRHFGTTWTSESGWYTQQLTVSGMKASYYPTLIPTYSSASVVSDMQAALGKIAYIETGADFIKAYATEAPTVEITFELVGV